MICIFSVYPKLYGIFLYEFVKSSIYHITLDFSYFCWTCFFQRPYIYEYILNSLFPFLLTLIETSSFACTTFLCAFPHNSSICIIVLSYYLGIRIAAHRLRRTSALILSEALLLRVINGNGQVSYTVFLNETNPF